MLGWVFIGLAAILLVILTLIFNRGKGYAARHRPEFQTFINARSAAIERGQKQHIVLGHQLWSGAYPGLGLHPLLVLPTLLEPEILADGGLTIDGSDGSLVVLARQIIHHRYDDGFVTELHNSRVRATLPGPTPLSFTAGILPEMGRHPQGSLVLLGNYGPEALLWTESVFAEGGHVLAGAGTLASQAVLFLSVRDLLIGESVFFLPGALESRSANHAGWSTEDILRILLMVSLISGAILKIVGIL